MWYCGGPSQCDGVKEASEALYDSLIWKSTSSQPFHTKTSKMRGIALPSQTFGRRIRELPLGLVVVSAAGIGASAGKAERLRSSRLP